MTNTKKRQPAEAMFFCYSKYPPNYYHQSYSPRGPIFQMGEMFLSHIGLWNLAWTANPSMFNDCENELLPPDMRPIWMGEGIQEVLRLGLTHVDGHLLRDLAAGNKAKKLIKIILAAKVVKPVCSDDFWKRWLAFAKGRVMASADMPCGLEILRKFEQIDAIPEGENARPVFAVRLPDGQVDLSMLAKSLRQGSTVH